MKKCIIAFLACVSMSCAYAIDVVDADDNSNAIAAASERESASVTDYAGLNRPKPTQRYVSADEHADAGDVLNKIDTLQQEVQQLRGQLEVAQHDVKLLRQQQQSFYQDLNQRINQLSSSAAKAPAAPIEVAAASTAPGTDKENQASVAYQKAYALVQQKDYANAVSALEAFVATYNSSEFAANAHYWLGELYLVQGHDEMALREFESVVRDFPKSNKVSGALLKLGFVYFEKGNWSKARTLLTQVKQTYPNTSVGNMASSKLQDMERQGL